MPGNFIPVKLVNELKYNIVNSTDVASYLDEIRSSGSLSYLPELSALIGVPQEPEWHPEGDVWTHLKLVMNEASRIKSRFGTQEEMEIFMFGALCHDLGKPYTTLYISGRWRSPGHDVIGEVPTGSLLKRLGYNKKFIKDVTKYVVHHLKPSNLYKTKEHVSLKAIERLSEKVDIPKLVLLSEADHFGRKIPEAITRENPAGEWLLKQYDILQHSSTEKEAAPKPYVTGKLLLSFRVQPGKQMGELIKEAYNLQLNGAISSEEEAYSWVKSKLNGKIIR